MNYLQSYQIWSSGDKAPEIYHTWAGLSTISSFSSRRIWLDQGRDRTYANLYVLFVGPAGNGKSTAMKTAQKLVGCFRKSCPHAPESGTWQSLVKDLADEKLHKRKFKYNDQETSYVHCSLFCDEFASLLQNDPGGWIKFLTRIYSCDDFDHKVKVAAEGDTRYDLVENPFMVFLGCMTPDITKEIIREGIVSTGFNRRCIFVYAGRSHKKIPLRTLTPEQMEARDFCVKWANLLVQQSGPFKFDKDAYHVYEEWYFENHTRLLNEPNQFFASWLDCKDQIILRVAMLMELGDNLDRILRASSIRKAIQLVGETEDSFHKVFQLSGRNPVADLANRARGIIEAVKDPVNAKLLRRQLRPYGTDQEINEAIQQLRADNLLEAIEEKDSHGATILLLGTPEQLESHKEKEKLVERPEISTPSNSGLFGFEAPPPE